MPARNEVSNADVSGKQGQIRVMAELVQYREPFFSATLDVRLKICSWQTAGLDLL